MGLRAQGQRLKDLGFRFKDQGARSKVRGQKSEGTGFRVPINLLIGQEGQSINFEQ